MSDQLSTREKLARLISRNPSLSLADLAQDTGVSRARDQQLLGELGYQYQPGRWVASASKTGEPDGRIRAADLTSHD